MLGSILAEQERTHRPNEGDGRRQKNTKPAEALFMPVSRSIIVRERPQQTSGEEWLKDTDNQFQTLVKGQSVEVWVFHEVHGRALQPTIGLFDGNRLANALEVCDAQLRCKRKSLSRKRSGLFRKEAADRLCLDKKNIAT